MGSTKHTHSFAVSAFSVYLQIQRYSLTLHSVNKVKMVISVPKFELPQWITNSLKSRKRRIESVENLEDPELAVAAVQPPVKKVKRTPPCKQCIAGLPGHWSHVKLSGLV